LYRLDQGSAYRELTQREMSNSPSNALLGNHVRDTAESACELRGDSSLTTDLDGLEWTQRYICDELCRGTGCQVDGSLESARVFLADQVAVEDLEILVSSILKSSLGLLQLQSV
jgi:hypothetical protein